MTDYEKWNKYCADLSSSSDDDFFDEPVPQEILQTSTPEIDAPDAKEEASVTD